MSRLIRSLPALGAVLALGLAYLFPLTLGETPDWLELGHFGGWFVTAVILIAALATFIKDDSGPAELWLAFAAIAAGLYLVALLRETEANAGIGYWALVAAAVLVTIELAIRLLTAHSPSRWLRAVRAIGVPVGAAVLLLLVGEVGLRGAGLAASVPPPSAIAHNLVGWATGAPANEEPADVAGSEVPLPTP